MLPEESKMELEESEIVVVNDVSGRISNYLAGKGIQHTLVEFGGDVVGVVKEVLPDLVIVVSEEDDTPLTANTCRALKKELSTRPIPVMIISRSEDISPSVFVYGCLDVVETPTETDDQFLPRLQKYMRWGRLEKDTRRLLNRINEEI